jgi:hypothetical protein
VHLYTGRVQPNSDSPRCRGLPWKYVLVFGLVPACRVVGVGMLSWVPSPLGQVHRAYRHESCTFWQWCQAERYHRHTDNGSVFRGRATRRCGWMASMFGKPRWTSLDARRKRGTRGKSDGKPLTRMPSGDLLTIRSLRLSQVSSDRSRIKREEGEEEKEGGIQRTSGVRTTAEPRTCLATSRQ